MFNVDERAESVLKTAKPVEEVIACSLRVRVIAHVVVAEAGK